jgi:hypothetical protein
VRRRAWAAAAIAVVLIVGAGAADYVLSPSAASPSPGSDATPSGNALTTPTSTANLAASSTMAAIPTMTPAPTVTPLPSPPPTATPTGAADPGADSLGLTATYEVHASFNWSTRAVSVDTTANVGNTSAGAVARLVFNLTPLTLANVHIDSVTVGGKGAVFGRDNPDQSLAVSLPSPLAPGAQASVEIVYEGSLNSSSSTDGWLFARTTVLTAYRWIPWLSRPIAWTPNELGDPWVTGISPQVNVAITTDEPLKIAATGTRESVSANGLVQTFSATNVRDFNFTAAPDYRTSSRTLAIGGRQVRVTVYYRTLPPATVLKWATTALMSYSTHIAPFVYDELNIGEVDANADPIESPGHFWIPATTNEHQLPWMVSHETGHQWFYAAVGNDQVKEPFADEALVDFMARNLVNSWAKSPARCAQQELDRSVSYYGACYPWVIYVQGNLYLRAYYQQVGASAFWRGVSNYFERYKWNFGGTRQLLDTLDAAAHVCYPHWLRFPTLYRTHC